MTHLTKLDETLNGDGDNCAVVESAADMAAVLVRASPSKAHSFAIAMHERACTAQDETALLFWRDVLTSLALSGDAGTRLHQTPASQPCK